MSDEANVAVEDTYVADPWTIPAQNFAELYAVSDEETRADLQKNQIEAALASAAVMGGAASSLFAPLAGGTAVGVSAAETASAAGAASKAGKAIGGAKKVGKGLKTGAKVAGGAAVAGTVATAAGASAGAAGAVEQAKEYWDKFMDMDKSGLMLDGGLVAGGAMVKSFSDGGIGEVAGTAMVIGGIAKAGYDVYEGVFKEDGSDGNDVAESENMEAESDAKSDVETNMNPVMKGVLNNVRDAENGEFDEKVELDEGATDRIREKAAVNGDKNVQHEYEM